MKSSVCFPFSLFTSFSFVQKLLCGKLGRSFGENPTEKSGLTCFTRPRTSLQENVFIESSAFEFVGCDMCDKLILGFKMTRTILLLQPLSSFQKVKLLLHKQLHICFTCMVFNHTEKKKTLKKCNKGHYSRCPM